MSLPERLAEAMKNANITSQRELSRRSGVSQSTIHRCLKSEYPSIQAMAIFRIAEVCNVSVDWLLGGSINPITSIEYSPREIELIKNFRRISATQREIIEVAVQSALTLRRKI